MNYGIAYLSVVPVRETISHRSEMMTQMLFGERCYIDEQYQDWYKLRLAHDQYSGWVDKKQIRLISEEYFMRLQSLPETVFVNTPLAFALSDHREVTMGFGSIMPEFKEGYFMLGEERFRLMEGDDYACTRKTPERLSFIALKYLGVPYLWGGRSFFGLDCSGFVQNVYRMCGYDLPRDAAQQAEMGTLISFVEEAENGDLFFFQNDENKIVHVGLYMGNKKIIHASGEVRLDKVDHQGIFHGDLSKYTHSLACIKRML